MHSSVHEADQNRDKIIWYKDPAFITRQKELREKHREKARVETNIEQYFSLLDHIEKFIYPGSKIQGNYGILPVSEYHAILYWNKKD
jgi:hypothetical protein